MNNSQGQGISDSYVEMRQCEKLNFRKSKEKKYENSAPKILDIWIKSLDILSLNFPSYYNLCSMETTDASAKMSKTAKHKMKQFELVCTDISYH